MRGRSSTIGLSDLNLGKGTHVAIGSNFSKNFIDKKIEVVDVFVFILKVSVARTFDFDRDGFLSKERII